MDCPRCTYSANSKYNLIRHLSGNKCINIHGGKKYVSKKKALDYVMTNYGNKKSLEKTKNDKNSEKDNKLICEACSKTYSKNGNLYRHIRNSESCKQKYLDSGEQINDKHVQKTISNHYQQNIWEHAFHRDEIYFFSYCDCILLYLKHLFHLNIKTEYFE